LELLYPQRSGIYSMRFGVDGPTATLLSLVDARAGPGGVELRWAGEGAGSMAAWVERRDDAESWRVVGHPVNEGPDLLRYVDRDVVAGKRYAYRLGWRDAGEERFTGEAWVEVPSEFRLALEGLRPNPARAENAAVAFTLAGSAQATLELLDVTGRRVVSREVGALGPGRHVIRLGGDLAAGIYVMRLRTGMVGVTSRAVILK